MLKDKIKNPYYPDGYKEGLYFDLGEHDEGIFNEAIEACQEKNDKEMRRLFEELGSTMELEQCDPSVMVYFNDYLVLDEGDYQSLKAKFLGGEG